MGLVSIQITACGKKSNSLSENLINENAGQINMDNIEYPAEEDDEIDPLLLEAGADSDSGIISVEGDPEAEAAASELISGESEEETSEDADEMEETETTEAPVEEGAIENNTAVAESVTINNTLSIANLSGKNLSQLYITYNTGSLVDNEILQGKKLNDGDTLEYIVLDMDSLRSASDLILTIVAYDKNDNRIEFGDLRIIDPAHMNVVLTFGDEGYTMYID